MVIHMPGASLGPGGCGVWVVVDDFEGVPISSCPPGQTIRSHPWRRRSGRWRYNRREGELEQRQKLGTHLDFFAMAIGCPHGSHVDAVKPVPCLHSHGPFAKSCRREGE